jgi:uncharacterized protein
MRLVNEFVVPRVIDEAWAVLTDVQRIAPAMPGARLTGVQDGIYSGTVKVKVGPVTAAYAGTASFRERDEQTHRVVLDATGKESTGRGRAAAVVTAQLTPEGEQTRVLVTTDLTISGPLAQFGRGAISEVSTRLLKQFVSNLQETVLADGAVPAPSTQPESVAEPADASAARENAVAEPAPPAAAQTGRVTTTPAVADRAIDDPAVDNQAIGDPSVDDETIGDPAVDDRATSGPPGGAPPAGPIVGVPAAAEGQVGGAAAVDLLRVAAWPVLKRVVPVVVLVVVVVLLIVWLV